MAGAAGVENALVAENGPVVVGSNAGTCQKYSLEYTRSCCSVSVVWFGWSGTVQAILLLNESVSPTSTRYAMAPTGPLRVALVTTSDGRMPSTTALGAGDTGTGSLITIGVNTLKLETGEYGPVLAPSCARARQKYVCPVASG